uniref:Caudal' n=1 Tax=Megaselia abdita TaxID=88686 RepID=A9YU96_MEGAB|nr:caudal' [Megaselia abdita]
MVSGYYNPLQYQKHTSAYPPGNWFPPANYATPHPQQFLNDVHEQHQAALTYYNQTMFPPGDWHAPDTMQSPPTSHHGSSHHMLYQSPATNSQTQLNETTSSNGDSNHNSHPTPNLTEALPSPPITVSGSELSSPGGAPVAASSPNGNIGSHGRASPSTDKNVYYDWMKKPSYPAQPTPVSTGEETTDSAASYGSRNGKTRTKDKYRVVYSDFQRLELEKEYCTARYITIRRKSELATSLQLSERQVKIWFQNRRAKERKQQKKRDDPVPMMGADYMDTKPKIEPGAHHLLHQMQMHMAMPPMGLHHHGLHHPHAHTHALLQQSQHHNLHPIHSQMPGSVPTPPM